MFPSPGSCHLLPMVYRKKENPGIAGVAWSACLPGKVILPHRHIHRAPWSVKADIKSYHLPLEVVLFVTILRLINNLVLCYFSRWPASLAVSWSPFPDPYMYLPIQSSWIGIWACVFLWLSHGEIRLTAEQWKWDVYQDSLGLKS